MVQPLIGCIYSKHQNIAIIKRIYSGRTCSEHQRMHRLTTIGRICSDHQSIHGATIIGGIYSENQSNMLGA